MKPKKYWLKGGVGGFLIGLVASGIFCLKIYQNIHGDPSPVVLILFPAIILIATISASLIGAMLGLLYGKIKNRNNVT
jgi:hypothetical protein